MEALVAASIAALTVYDMCKALDKGIEIRGDGARTQIRRQERRLSPASARRPSLTVMANQVKILLVDDNPMVLAMLQEP